MIATRKIKKGLRFEIPLQSSPLRLGRRVVGCFEIRKLENGMAFVCKIGAGDKQGIWCIPVSMIREEGWAL